MHYALTIKTAPTAEPVTLAEAKEQCEYEETDRDAWFRGKISAARRNIEKRIERALVSRTYYYKCGQFPNVFKLPYPPLSSVPAITYIDINGTTQTLAESVYDVDTDSERGRIVRAYNQVWPDTRSDINAVTVEYVAGYGEPGDVPEDYKHAVLLLIAHWFKEREGVITGRSSKRAEEGIATLIGTERLMFGSGG